jgi:hypothetical protein
MGSAKFETVPTRGHPWLISDGGHGLLPPDSRWELRHSIEVAKTP